jgi:hypothetical protein
VLFAAGPNQQKLRDQAKPRHGLCEESAHAERETESIASRRTFSMYFPIAKVDIMPTANVMANAASVSSAELLYGMVIDSCYEINSGHSREIEFIVVGQLDKACPVKLRDMRACIRTHIVQPTRDIAFMSPRGQTL